MLIQFSAQNGVHDDLLISQCQLLTMKMFLRVIIMFFTHVIPYKDLLILSDQSHKV